MKTFFLIYSIVAMVSLVILALCLTREKKAEIVFLLKNSFAVHVWPWWMKVPFVVVIYFFLPFYLFGYIKGIIKARFFN